MASQKRVGVLLSGCGFLDGAEIHEAVCTLLSLDRRGAKLVAMAPDVPQMHVVDHLAQQPAAGQSRSVLVEAARLARGQITELGKVKAAELDALILPGGFGAAKNLCSFATDGRQMRVLPAVEALVRAMRAAGKPMGFICIAPVVAARVLGAEKVKLTIGNDAETAAAME
jgi:enhancing lycopene biosynthesis protein 2